VSSASRLSRERLQLIWDTQLRRIYASDAGGRLFSLRLFSLAQLAFKG